MGVDGTLVGGEHSSDPPYGVGGNSAKEVGVAGLGGIEACGVGGLMGSIGMGVVGASLSSLPHSQNSFLGGGAVRCSDAIGSWASWPCVPILSASTVPSLPVVGVLDCPVLVLVGVPTGGCR